MNPLFSCVLLLLLQEYSQKVCRQTGVVLAGKCERFCNEIEGHNSVNWTLSVEIPSTKTLYLTSMSMGLGNHGSYRGNQKVRYFEICND